MSLAETFYKKCTSFLSRHSKLDVLRLLCAPITVLVTTPVRLVQCLYQCRVLADGKWSHYSGFSSQFGTNQLFYWTIAYNLDRYGFRGSSPTLGTGSYPLARLFHFCLPSIYLNWFASNVTVLSALFSFALFYTLWLSDTSSGIVFLIVLTVIFSTSFYRLIGVENYNVVGLMFMPLALYGIGIGDWYLAGLAWLLVSLGSFTAVAIGGLWTIVAALHYASLMPLLAFAPAALKIFTHLIPIFSGSVSTSAFSDTLKAIGVSRSDAKYTFTLNTKDYAISLLQPHNTYMIFMYVLFLVGAAHNTESIFWQLFLVSFILFVLNQSQLLRFADPWTFTMVLLALSTAEILTNFTWSGYLVYLLVINPIPYIQSWSTPGILDVVPRQRPFLVMPIIESLKEFLAGAPAGSSILICHDDPRGNQLNIFDGYRSINEVLYYVGNISGVRVFPDWHALFQMNRQNADGFWGRTRDSIESNVRKFRPEYIIVYDTHRKPLALDELAYPVISVLDWAIFDELFAEEKPYIGLDHPRWYLLRVSAGASCRLEIAQ